ncbi:MAG: sugar phosphate isomerase/epimerase family protein, partial [Planctomycetota bacterium]
QLDVAGIGVNCFGSAIANWKCSVFDDFADTIRAVERTIPRMQRLGSTLIRIMSYRVEHEAPGYSDQDQQAQERFRRMREIVARFRDAGIQPVHENCMNYGGMGPAHSLRLLEAVPDLRLVFDTGNPVFTRAYEHSDPERRQDAWEFYAQVKDHIAYVHIKDGIWDPESRKCTYTWPGEGQGQVERIVGDLLANGYDGGFSMEPHLQVVFHEGDNQDAKAEARKQAYIEYGRRFVRLLERIGHPVA